MSYIRSISVSTWTFLGEFDKSSFKGDALLPQIFGVYICLLGGWTDVFGLIRLLYILWQTTFPVTVFDIQ